MHRKLEILAAVLLLCALASGAPPAAAQASASMSGLVRDMDGKPMADARLELKNTATGAAHSAKTDENGRYNIEGLRSGPYEFTVSDQKGFPLLQSKFDVHSGENPLDLNLKELVNPEQLAARKKAEQETMKFQNMKAAFEAGRGLMDQAQQLRAQLSKAPVAERAPMQEKLNGLYEEAVGDFRNAQSAAPEKDPNQQLFWYNIAEASEGMGKNDQAVEAYQKAIELASAATGKGAPAKSQIAAYYSNLGNLYGKMKKVDEANKAYEAAAAADPGNAAMVWLNSGIILYNAARLPEAIGPLKKATALNPNAADAWYLLGASLLSTIESKQEGDKLIYIIPPGTVDAYQRYLQLAPNGPHAADAKAALDGLQALGAGVEAKVKAKKGKS